MKTPSDTATRAVHLLLPSELVSSLDMYRNRYTTRTALIAHAIERYVASLTAAHDMSKPKS